MTMWKLLEPRSTAPRISCRSAGLPRLPAVDASCSASAHGKDSSCASAFRSPGISRTTTLGRSETIRQRQIRLEGSGSSERRTCSSEAPRYLASAAAPATPCAAIAAIHPDSERPAHRLLRSTRLRRESVAGGTSTRAWSGDTTSFWMRTSAPLRAPDHAAIERQILLLLDDLVLQVPSSASIRW